MIHDVFEAEIYKHVPYDSKAAEIIERARAVRDFLVARELEKNRRGVIEDDPLRALVRDYERSLYR